jgi:hypothetical protein
MAASSLQLTFGRRSRLSMSTDPPAHRLTSSSPPVCLTISRTQRPRWWRTIRMQESRGGWRTSRHSLMLVSALNRDRVRDFETNDTSAWASRILEPPVRRRHGRKPSDAAQSARMVRDSSALLEGAIKRSHRCEQLRGGALDERPLPSRLDRAGWRSTGRPAVGRRPSRWLLSSSSKSAAPAGDSESVSNFTVSTIAVSVSLAVALPAAVQNSQSWACLCKRARSHVQSALDCRLTSSRVCRRGVEEDSTVLGLQQIRSAGPQMYVENVKVNHAGGGGGK